MSPAPHEPDEDLRALLRPGPRTPAEHDDAVLTAARALSNEGRTGHESRRYRRLAVRFAIAAGIVGMAVGLYVRVGGRLEDDGVLRSLASEPGRPTVPANGADLDAPPIEFSWPLQADAKSYRVILRDASARIIWRSGQVTANRASLHVPVATTLAPQTYYWTVEVERSESIRELGPFWFRLE